jgi:hypothetical protein
MMLAQCRPWTLDLYVSFRSPPNSILLVGAVRWNSWQKSENRGCGGGLRLR